MYKKLLPALIRNLVDDEICWLAGGALRALFEDTTPADYDLFFRNPAHVTIARDSLTQAGFKLIFECPEGKLFTYMKEGVKIQCVCERYYTVPEEIIDTFDIIPGCAVLLPRGEVLAHVQFLTCIEQGIILFHKISYPTSTLIRISKYSRNHGYHLPAEAARFFLRQVRRHFTPTDLWRAYID